MITKRQATRLKTLVTQLVNAAREDEMKGSQLPADADTITAELAAAQDKLNEFIATITRQEEK